MSGVATAAVVGSAITAKGNKDAADAASKTGRPKFASVVEPGIRRQMQRTQNTSRDIYQGDRVAGFSDEQQRGFEMTPDLVNLLQSQQGTAGAGFNQFASGSMVGQNPFLEDAIGGMRETAFRDLSRNQLPAVRNNAVAEGGIGGSRQGIAEGLALSDLNRDLLAREGTMRANQVNVDQGNMLNALINQGNILSGQTQPQDLLFRTGAMQQGQQQLGIDANMAQFNEEQDLQFQRDQQLLSILLGTPAGQPVVPGQVNPMAGGLGAALMVSQLRNQQPQAPQQQPVNNAPFTGYTGGDRDFFDF